jgi:ABC-type antimicrobial peptide transport system permease subunit
VIAVLALPLIVLAIGCANVANLHLARVAEQSRELAVRLALGATRAQLVRLLTLETLARVLIAVGLSIGLILLSLVRMQPMVPVFVSVDWRVLLFAVSLALGVSLATGLMPAWIVLRRTAAGELKQGSQGGGLRHSRLRSALIVGQVNSRIITLVIRQALKLVLTGMACGLALAVPMAFVMPATFVAKVTATDPMVFVPTLSVLLTVGILAAAFPALRASRIDPIATLRQE